LSLCQRFQKISGYTAIWDELWESIIEDVKGGNLRNVAVEKPLHGRLIALRYASLRPIDIDQCLEKME
jgi:hypothetical protein